MTTMKLFLTTLAAIGVALTDAQVASADEDMYLTELRQKVAYPLTDAQAFQLGQVACNALREGINSGLSMGTVTTSGGSGRWPGAKRHGPATVDGGRDVPHRGCRASTLLIVANDAEHVSGVWLPFVSRKRWVDETEKRRDRRASIDGFAQIRWAIIDLGPSPHTGQALILIPGATAAVRFAAPSAPMALRSADLAHSVDRRSRTDRAWFVAENREEDSHPTRSPQVVRSQDTAPSGDSTEVPNRPSQRDGGSYR